MTDIVRSLHTDVLNLNVFELSSEREPVDRSPPPPVGLRSTGGVKGFDCIDITFGRY